MKEEIKNYTKALEIEMFFNEKRIDLSKYGEAALVNQGRRSYYYFSSTDTRIVRNNIMINSFDDESSYMNLGLD